MLLRALPFLRLGFLANRLDGKDNESARTANRAQSSLCGSAARRTHCCNRPLGGNGKSGIAAGSHSLLVELGLTSARLARQRNSETASKASQLAAEQIGKLLDPLLPEEEKRARRHRLIRGPREFRDLRKKPKA